MTKLIVLTLASLLVVAANMSPTSSLPSNVFRTGSDIFHPPASTTVLIFGQVPNMATTIQVNGRATVQFLSECAVSVTMGGWGVLLWVRVLVDGAPAGDPANSAYPGVHELCGVTAATYVVSEGYRSTMWTVEGLSRGPHSFAIEATLVGFSSGTLTGPGPGTDGSLGLRTFSVQG